ncbi:protein of unknown function [Pseudomonas sp. JV241A]|nr:protein of unknown function [Pseudomonas sp. JV241A]
MKRKTPGRGADRGLSILVFGGPLKVGAGVGISGACG